MGVFQQETQMTGLFASHAPTCSYSLEHTPIYITLRI